jgi:predicted nucleic acid-binding protein
MKTYSSRTSQKMRIGSSLLPSSTHEYEITRAEVVWPGHNLADAYASLRTWCVRTGHGLGQKEHEADRWVAATAVWLQVPLVAHDSIFTNVKDLELLTRLGD